MFNLKKINKIRRNVKAISPVISVLLMIAVAVVASLVAYAWVMGYMNFQTAKTGQAVQIQSVARENGLLTVYVQNVGEGAVSFSNPCVYVNGTAASGYTVPATPTTAGTTVAFHTNQPVSSADKVTVKVTVTDGTFSEVTKVFP
jgi:flagellin-like protein